MIFLDVGTYEGETLEEVTSDRWGFTEIHGFEPMPYQWAVAHRDFSWGATVWPFGLADFTGWTTMYGQNTKMEASVYADKVDVDPDEETRVFMVKASDFVDGLPDDMIVMKLNCECAEVAILNDLCTSGEIHSLYRVMVDFDASRVPSIAHQVDPLLQRMADAGFDRYDLQEDVMHGGTHQDRIANWLQGCM